MSGLPIIVLAFANEHEVRRYLRDLPEELRALQEIVKEAERNRLCRLELLPNATLPQLFDVFTRNRGQVTILHYAGHANSGQLLLESSAEGCAPAHAGGLATFLGHCEGLQLVFLNGCSTRAQAARLIDAGVASVITTARAIDDSVARAFAVAFYTELASGQALRAAFELSRARVLAARGDEPGAYYRTRELGDPATDIATPDSTDDRGFPWEFRAGTELVERWSLPDAAGNPEFGLPTLPFRDLPSCPFRHLAWFAAEHSEVFFGRSYEIRELYEQLSDSSGPTILLLYGASGVGKSSLLDAGLLPRLQAAGHEVRYCRRDQQKGLSKSLRDMTEFTGKSTLLNEAWHEEEARRARPLFLFLDQVEEVFTRPSAALPRELDDFVAILKVALANRANRPRGKLVLGFRKEWLAEIERRLAEAKIAYVKVFLQPLDRRGIIEAILGPARLGRLQLQYRLAIESGLPEVIADNLLADAGSALAPTLQVLLSKMWERAGRSNPDEPRFSRDLYESLKKEGYLLKDVLDEGLKAIGRWNPTIEASGLALDVLVYHTTDLGTAARHTRLELDQRYAHHAGSLGGLIGQCKACYLLIEAETNSDCALPSTRLAHDLLAPLVQQRFRLSLAAGQRARRLLENRAPEWHGSECGPVLDGTDLATVEEGAPGMRLWTADETRLVEASRCAQEQVKAKEQERACRLHEAEERQRHAEAEKQRETEHRLKDQEESNRRLRKRAVVLVATLAVTVGVALLAGYLWRDAKDAATKERQAAAEAKKQTRNANAQRLAAISREVVSARPQLCLILAVEAVRVTLDHGEPVAPTAKQAIVTAVSSVQGRGLSGHEAKVWTLAFAPDGRLVTGSGDKTARVWDLNDPGAPPIVLKGHEGAIPALAFAPDGRLVTASVDQTARVWNLNAPGAEPLLLKGHEGGIYALAFAPDGRLVTGSSDKTARIWDLTNPGTKPIILTGHEGEISDMAFAPDGRLVTGSYDKTARIWDLKNPGAPPIVLKGHEREIFALAFAPDGRLVTGSFDKTARIWDLTNPGAKPIILKGHEGEISDMAFAPDGRLVTGSFDKTARIWDLKNPGVPPIVLKGHEGQIFALAFTRDGRLVTCSDDQTARVWNLKAPTTSPIVLMGHEGDIYALAFSVDGRLVTGSADRTARVWELKAVAAEPLVLKGHSAAIRTVAFATDGRLATGSLDKTARVWDLQAPKAEPLVLKGHKGAIHTMAFAPDGRLVTGNEDHTARVWNLKDPGAPPIVLKGHEAKIWTLAFAPDGRLATGSDDKTARVWDLNVPTADPIVFKGHEGQIWAMAFAPDGRLVTCSDDQTARVWDLKAPATPPIILKGHEAQIFNLAFAPDGRLVTCSEDRTVRVWDLKAPTASPIVLKGHEALIRALAFAPDGRLVTGSWDKTARIWDLKAPGASPIVLKGHESGIDALAFAPDGRLVTGSWDHTARVWDLKDPGAPPIVLKGHEGPIFVLGFASDGRLVTCSDDGTARAWELDLDNLINLSGQIASRNLTMEEWREYMLDTSYRRSFRNLPWPMDLERTLRDQAEQREKELRPIEDKSTR